MKLSKTAIEKIQPNHKEQVLLDGELKGFGVRISPAGRRVFFYRYRIGGRNGKQRRVTLGKFGEITVDGARKQQNNMLETSLVEWTQLM